jgi:hypothetical protein
MSLVFYPVEKNTHYKLKWQIWPPLTFAIFQSLWFISGFPWWRVAANKVSTEPWLGWTLWNICVTNDHGYVPLVVNTSRSFPHSRLITGFVTMSTRRAPLVEQELPTLSEHLSSPLVFSGIPVTRSLVLYVCFVCFDNDVRLVLVIHA